MKSSEKVRVDRRTYKRIFFFLILFLLAAVAIIIKLVNLQLVNHQTYEDQVLKQITTETTVAPTRGKILCSDGVTVIADSKTVYNIIISPEDIMSRDREIAEKNSDDNPDNDFSYDWTSKDGGKSYKGTRTDEFIATMLSYLLDVDYNEIMTKAAKEGRMYEEIKKNVEEDVNDEIEEAVAEYDLDNQLYDRASTKRYYPMGDFACHVIGFTNADGDGAYGLEAQYNEYLKGTEGRYILAQDAKNNDLPFGYETYIEAVDGYTIVTTLDKTIQETLEAQLRATYYDNKSGNRVTGIVLDVETGAVLAMATYPTYDLNDPFNLSDEDRAELDSEYEKDTEEYENAYKELLYSRLNNKAITETYEPGSTFKIITTSMALEEKKVTFDTPFSCTGSLMVEGWSKPIACHYAQGHGIDFPFWYGLQQSCNPTLMQVAALVGREKFYEYFEAYGYTSKTGIDLPGEVGGIYADYDNFSGVSLAVYSFGQTFKTTPIQQITAISAVANGGYIVTPHVLDKVLDSEGNVVYSYDTDVKRQVVSTEVCEDISVVLEDGVSGDGGAKNAYVKGYKVAAKTGTSEKRDTQDENGEYSLRVGSTVAYAPSDDPQISALIMVDEPMGGSVYGSVVAAPYISKLLGTVLPYLGVERNYTESDLANMDTTVGDYTGSDVSAAAETLRTSGITVEIVGNGEKVTSQFPIGGSVMNIENGKVILYTEGETARETVTMPSLIGLNAESANSMVVGMGLNIHITGATNSSASTVLTQSPAAGETVEKGTVVEISMAHLDVTD